MSRSFTITKNKDINIINSKNKNYTLIRKAVHPSLYLTGGMTNEFFAPLFGKIKEKAKELSGENPELSIKYANLVRDKISKYLPSINKEIDVAHLIQDFEEKIKGWSVDLAIGTFLHDCLHEILVPGSVKKFLLVPADQQADRGVFSPQTRLEEDLPSFFDYKVSDIGIGYFVWEEFIDAAESLDSNKPKFKSKSLWESDYYANKEYDVVSLQSIFRKAKSTIFQKSKDLSQFARKTIIQILNKIFDRIQTLSGKENTIDALTKDIIKDTVGENLLPSQGKKFNTGIMTDLQAKNIRLFHSLLVNVIRDAEREIETEMKK